MISCFVANSEKCRKYTFLGGAAMIITILHRGVIKIYYNITWGGGLPDLLQYYKGEEFGVSRDPKFVLRNIWTAPNFFLSELPRSCKRNVRVHGHKRRPLSRFPPVRVWQLPKTEQYSRRRLWDKHWMVPIARHCQESGGQTLFNPVFIGPESD